MNDISAKLVDRFDRCIPEFVGYKLGLGIVFTGFKYLDPDRWRYVHPIRDRLAPFLVTDEIVFEVLGMRTLELEYTPEGKHGR